jgi:hypothetical protein
VLVEATPLSVEAWFKSFDKKQRGKLINPEQLREHIHLLVILDFDGVTPN